MVEQNVVQLKISVDDPTLVQKVESQTDFCRVEASVLLGQTALALHAEHQISATDELDDEEQPGERSLDHVLRFLTTWETRVSILDHIP